MAKFGLKKQGTLWGLFHGSEMVSERTDRIDCNLSENRARSHTAESVAQQPAYDNDGEYRNVQTALEEVQQHPPLENPEKQQERERLQGELEVLVRAFPAKHGSAKGIAWDAQAEEELHALMHMLLRLLKMVGLSLEHGWAYTGAD
jgi:hypothetical protein